MDTNIQRGKHRAGWRDRLRHGAKKSLAILGVGGVMLAGSVAALGAGAAPAQADAGSNFSPPSTPGNPWSHNAGLQFGVGSGGSPVQGGYYAGNFEAGDGSLWLCAVDGSADRPPHGNANGDNYNSPQVVTSWQGSATSGASGALFTGPTISDHRLDEAAYIASVYGDSSSSNEAAASQVALQRIFEVYEGSNYQYSVDGDGTNSMGPAVGVRADEMIDDAQANRGPYEAGQPSITLEANGRTGDVQNIGVRGGAGNWLSGYDFTATISGPAEWASGGQTFTGTTSGSPITRGINATGNGNVSVELLVHGLPAPLVVATSSSDQDIFAAGLTQEVYNSGDPMMMIMDFQPEISTQVDSKFISKGDAFADNVTASAASGDSWSIIQGAYVPVIAEGTLYGPYDEAQTPSQDVPAGAPVAGTAELTFNGPETLVAGQDIIAETSGYYTWVWDINVSSQPSEYQDFIRDDYTDGFFTVGETSIVRVTPSIVTERDDQFIVSGDELVDNVTLSLADGDRWPTDEDGNSVVIDATATAYGPFDAPQEQTDEVPSGAPVAGTVDMEFAAEGTQQASINVDAEGFYTWVIDIDGADYYDGYVTPFFEEIETSSARYELTHWSEAREYNVVPGGRAFDTIDIDGFPGHHGEFDGLGDWDADLLTAEVTVYGPMSQAPSTEEVPSDAPVFWNGEVDAQNGRFEVGYDDEDPISPTEQGHYVFVYSFDGDAKVAPFTSDFNDLRERFYVPGEGEPTPEGPSVITRAVPTAVVGEPIHDEAMVTGEVQEGSELTFDLYGPFERGEDGQCVAPGSIEEAGEPVFTSGPHPVDSAGVYTSDEYITTDAGCHFWVETLRGPDGEVEHQGEIGAPGETSEVFDRDVTVTTQVQFEGEGDRPVVGDEIWDEVLVEGDVREGDYVVVDLYTWEEGQEPVCEDPIWTSERIELDGAGEYQTGRYVTLEAVVHGFVETTYDAEGEIISRGVCGEPSETIEVDGPAEPEPQEGGGEAGTQAGGGQLENTGVGLVPLAALGALTLAGGLVARRFARN